MSGGDLLCALLAGIVATAAWRCARTPAHPSRWRSTAFFAVLSSLLVAAPLLPAAVTGVGVLLVLGLGASGLQRLPAGAPATLKTEHVPSDLPARWTVFVPILLLPLLTVLGAWTFRHWPLPGLEPRLQAIAALALAAAITLTLSVRWTRSAPRVVPSVTAGLLDALGWAFVLPVLLAVLGGLLQQAGVAQALSEQAARVLWVDSRTVCILAYGLGMAGLTILTGNAFAAFPVVMAAIGVPFLILQHGADPAPLAAIGMLCGYCGTLLTPMAANFNLVPAALLELPDRNAVIRAQVGTALPLLAANLALLWWLV